MAAEEAPQIIDGLPLIEAATGKKNEANALVKEKKLDQAISLYEKAIEILDKADGHPMLRQEVEQMVALKSVLYSNVAQCLLSQSLFRRAVTAATSSIEADPANAKALHRRSQAYEALKKWKNAHADTVALHKLGGGALSAEAIEIRLKILQDKIDEIQKLKDEESSEDGWGEEMVQMKKRFEEVVLKYDLKDEGVADEIAEWLTSGEWIMTIKKVAHRWKMEYDDAEDFLKWIAKGVQFKAEQSQMSDLMEQSAPALGDPTSVE